MSADSAAGKLRQALASDDNRLLLPIEEVAGLMDVSVAMLKRQHRADPANYPARRIGVLWRIPRAWVEAQVSWSPAPASGPKAAAVTA